MMALEKIPLWAWSVFKRNKTRRVLEEMQEGGFTIEQAMSTDSEIYHLTTFLDALGKAASYEKATLLKELYLSERRADGMSDDLFMEVFSTLAELSDREIFLLHLVDCYDKNTLESALDLKKGTLDNYKPKTQEMGDGVDSDAFFYLLGNHWGIEPAMVEALLRRLERTGMIYAWGIDGNSLFQVFRPSILYQEVRGRITKAIEEAYGNATFAERLGK